MERSAGGANSGTARGFGMAASAPWDVVASAATGAEQAGYHSFWLNNPPGANALEPLGRIAKRVSSLWLGVGVIPLSATSPETVVRETRESGVPLDRFYLGIGSGGGSGGVERVAAGVRRIREELECVLVVAALGPRMCRLAGAEADGVLLNWLTPQFARTSVEWIREAATEANRPMPRVMAYVRAALGEEAIARLRREAASYESFPQYASHFRRMGVAAMGTAVTGTSPQAIREGLADWDGVVDEVVVRAIGAQDTEDEVGRLLEAAAPR